VNREVRPEALDGVGANSSSVWTKSCVGSRRQGGSCRVVTGRTPFRCVVQTGEQLVPACRGVSQIAGKELGGPHTTPVRSPAAEASRRGTAAITNDQMAQEAQTDPWVVAGDQAPVSRCGSLSFCVVLRNVDNQMHYEYVFDDRGAIE